MCDMNSLLEIMAGKLTGRIHWEIRKSTKMNIDRYLDMMLKLLANQVEKELQFIPLPPSLDPCVGEVDRIMNTTEHTIQMTLQLLCRKITNEDRKQCGNITMQGTAKLGRLQLALSLGIASEVVWRGKLDPSQSRLKELVLSIPLTHITMSTTEGSYKLTCFNNVIKWNVIHGKNQIGTQTTGHISQ